MKLYRFSPISNDQAAQLALEHIDEHLRKLSELVIDERLPVNTLKIFAHYEGEYDFLKEWVDGLGINEDGGSSTSYYVRPSKPMTVNNDPVEYVGIRVPDPYRAQVGCGDYVVDHFDEFREKYLGKSPHIRQVPHQKYEMLELFHPDIDVLGYIVKKYE